MAIMILMILILTCTVFGVTVNGCPSSCSCRDTTVNCYRRGLTTVPSNVPNSTTILSLYNNKIATLDVQLFNGLSALQTLYLQQNQIVTLDVNVFNGLVDLKYLDLAGNKIAIIDVRLLKGLSALQTLYLNYNQIVSLHANVFNHLVHLKKLFLQHNQIVTLDVNLFNNLTALRILHLNNNQIVTLNVNVFNGLVDLKYLYLEYNQIATLDVNVFNGLAALNTLLLHNNQIVTLHVNVFNGLVDLKYLYLLGNPFDCSTCIMKSFQDFLQRNNSFGTTGARCDGETNQLIIYHNFISCKGTQTTTESYPSTVTTEYSARTTESKTESQTATESLRSSVTTEYQARTTESTTGIKNTEVIFISCGAGILFLLSAGIICYCARKKCKRGNINPNVINHGDNVDRRADISPNVSTNGGSDAQYAEIEEIEMADVIVSTLEQRNLIGGDISSGSSADGIQADEESGRTNTNVYQSLQENRLNESRQYSSLTSVHIEQRNLTDGDISSDSSADEIQGDEESRRTNTNVYQSLQRSSLNESRLYSSLKSVNLEEIVDEPI